MKFLRPIIILGTLALSLSLAQAQGGPGMGQGQGRGMGQGAGLGAKRVECRTKANEKGLVGQTKRAERQKFMQQCVHGTN